MQSLETGVSAPFATNINVQAVNLGCKFAGRRRCLAHWPCHPVLQWNLAHKADAVFPAIFPAGLAGR